MNAKRNDVKCPECGSARIWKDGFWKLNDGRKIQRYICRDCGRRFVDPSKTSKRKSSSNFYCRVGGWNYQPKNSASLRLRKKALVITGRAESDSPPLPAKPTPQQIKEKIIQFSWWLHKEGYAKSTIISKTKLLEILAKRGANLFNPESVKEVIAKQNWSAGRKENAVDAYTTFLQMLGMTWNPPRYRRVPKLPFIPLEKEIDDLIAGCSRKVAAFLQLLKETGMRAGEAWQLEWTDVDFVKRTIRVTPEKGSNPRIFKVSDKLLAMLGRLPKKSNRVFGTYVLNGFARMFQRQRKRVAQKLQNPRLLRISFHTIRHWKATMEYQRTKDILYVMRLLGHKNIKNTLIYTQLVEFEENTDQYISKVATTVDEARELIEAGFEYVCDMDGVKIFRKRK